MPEYHWQTGKAVLDSTEQRIGVDTFHPVGGAVYRKVANGEVKYYMYAPAVSFHPRRPAINTITYDTIDAWSPTDKPLAYDVAPTGETFWVEVEPSCVDEIRGSQWKQPDTMPAPYSRWVFKGVLDGLPAGARLWRTGETFNAEHAPAEFYGTLFSARRGWVRLSKQVAHPLTHAVDPLFSILTNVGVHAGSVLSVAPVAVGKAVAYPFTAHSRSRQKAADAAQKTALAQTDAQIFVLRRGTSRLYSLNVPGGVSYHPLGLEKPVREPFLTEAEFLPYVSKKPNYALNLEAGFSEAEKQSISSSLQAHGIRIGATQEIPTATVLRWGSGYIIQRKGSGDTVVTKVPRKK